EYRPSLPAPAPASVPPAGTRASLWSCRRTSLPASTRPRSPTRLRDHVRGCLIALVPLAAIVPASSALAAQHQPAAGSRGIGIRLVEVPSASSRDPLGRMYIVERLAPGTSISRRVEISNTTQSTADVA